MQQITFRNWRETNPFIEKYLSYPEGKNFRWGRLQANWIEKIDKEKCLSHLYAFAIDLQTGDIYSDCCKSKIYTKFVALSLSRPFFGLTKTIYHLCLPISIPLEISQAIVDCSMRHPCSLSTIAWQAWRNVKYNIVDIVRTPLYTIALHIISIAAMIIGPFNAKKLYDLRAIAGRLENALNRGEDNFWIAAPCFQPFDNIMNIHQNDYVKPDTKYEVNPTLHSLNNLVRSEVNFRRKNRNFFNNCARLHPKNKSYVSRIFKLNSAIIGYSVSES